MRRLMSFATFLSAILVTSGLGNYALGYEVDTHRLINSRIFTVSDLRPYFDNELKISLTDSQTVLMQEGGYAEDSPNTWCRPIPLPPTPYPRAYNHYHDPLQTWADAGYTNPAWYNGISNVLWAQYNRLQNPPDLTILRCTGPNVWTWDSAYAFFLGGLTAQDSATRNQNLADLFTALGHLTHLVADVSVPEHTRNDAHVIAPHFETWCKANLTFLGKSIDGVRVFDNTFMPDPGIFAQGQGSAFGSGPLSPVSNLWDSHSSGSGYNPLLSATERLAGLADYSNFNYFSGDTVFEHVRYQHPNSTEVGLGLLPVTAQDGRTDYVIFFHRNTSDGIPVAHLAATGFHFQDLLDQGLDNAYQAAHLDEYCWRDYAKNLVPRAVSYGTALVNYFFRGRFNVTAEGNTLAVENLHSGTATGSVAVYADDASGKRTLVQRWENVLFGRAGEATVHQLFTFTGTAGVRYTMVFEGQMENLGEGGSTSTDHGVGGRVFAWTAAPGSLPSKIAVGDNPHGLAVTPDGKKLYVTNASENTVSVIDLTMGVEKRITGVGPTPVDVAFTPNGTKAFVANEGGRSVSVLDAVNDNVIGTVTGLAPNPEEVAVTPDGRYAYVAHWSFFPLTRIDTSDFSAVRILTPQQLLQGIALHPVEPLAYVTYYTFYWGQSVGVLDRGDDSLQATWPGADLNWGAALGAGNRYLFVANPRDTDKSVTAYDTLTGQIAAVLPVGGSPRGVTASPDGSRVYVANILGDSVTVIDAINRSVIGTIDAGDGAYDVALSPDGRYLFVSNAFEDSVSAIPLNTSGMAATPASRMVAQSAVQEEASWGTVVLAGFPAGGRVTVDGDFPRREAFVEGGYAVSFPAGGRTVRLVFPGYVDRAIPVTVGAGEILSVDGRMTPE